jgi:plastocyanin
MQTRLRVVTALSVFGTIVGCGTRQVPLLTADRVATTPGARNLDGLWLIALPPVVVQPARELRDDSVRVTLSEWRIELSRDQVAPGTVVFQVRNKGTVRHAFEIEGQGVEREIGPIRPGADTLITLRVREGKYEVYCPVGEGTAHAHKAMGMLSALTVGSPSAGSSSQFQEH